MQGSLNMNTLSSFGISFFVPLFGGIGSSIISGSGAILGMAATPQVVPFQTVILIYIAIMSYIMCSFKTDKWSNATVQVFPNNHNRGGDNQGIRRVHGLRYMKVWK